MRWIRRSIRTKLLLAFSVDLLLMFALGSFAAYQLATMNTAATFVERYTIPSLDLTDKFDLVITKYRSLQLEYIINRSSADRARIEAEMAELEQSMQRYFARYTPLIASAAERSAYDELLAAWLTYASANNERFLPSTRLDNTGTVQPAFNRLNPLYDELVSAVQRLVNLTQAQANTALSSVQQSYRSSRYVIASETVLSLVLSALIGLVLAQRIARRIRKLTDATAVVAAGDLERRVVVRTQDELGTLANSFNQMVVSLKEQRAMLEVRNAELQQSLETQQQLTEDLMRRKAAEEAAVRARATAEAASQAKSMFLATMSHELRTPLNAILGYTQIMHLQASASGHSDFVPALERVRSAGRHLLTLISNVLDFSKIEQGKLDMNISEFDVAALVRDVISVVAPLAENNQNSLQAVERLEQPLFHSDEGKLRQVLFNLLSNAIKFTHSGMITVLLRQEQRDERHWLLIAVRDTGIGIDQAQQQALFKPFTQASPLISRTYGGTGLGLALSQELCRLLGGTISVESAPGVGSTFTIQLPDHVAAGPFATVNSFDTTASTLTG